MFPFTKRYLMSEADSGSGNGAAVPPPADTSNVSQAQGDAVTLSRAELDSLISEAASKAVASAKDSIYAEARRTFTEAAKKSKPTKADEPAPQPASAPDPTRLRALDRALAKSGHAERLSEAQYKRIERVYLEESPDDASGWVKDYFDGLGVAQPATQPAIATAAAPARPVAEHPVSNRGAPPPAQIPIEEIDLVSASESDRAAYIKAKGPKAYVDRLTKQLKGRPVRVA